MKKLVELIQGAENMQGDDFDAAAARKKAEMEAFAADLQTAQANKPAPKNLVEAANMPEMKKELDLADKNAKITQDLAEKADGSGVALKDSMSKKDQFTALADAFGKMNKGREEASQAAPEVAAYAQRMMQSQSADPIEEILRRNKKG